jgi:hypothetical protein
MNNHSPMQNRNTELQMDAFGARLSAWLDQSAQDVPSDVMERLRASRMQAIAKRRILKIETATAVFANLSSATLGGGAPFSFWGRAASLLPLVALLVGLLGIGILQEDQRAQELAEVDTAILTDELPPSAYTDAGFAQFLKAASRD